MYAADPTRRAIFGRLCRDGEQTVRVLTGYSGVWQPAVSKHLGVLKLAGWCATATRDARPTTAPSHKVWRALTHGPLIEAWLMQNELPAGGGP